MMKRKPVLTPAAGKASTVTLSLAAGETVDNGSVPNADPAGWDALKTLDLTKPANTNDRKYVRFHILNERAGGPGDEIANLSPTTAKANHIAQWAGFETSLKNAVTPGTAVAHPTLFSATLSYPAANTVYWQRSTGKTVTTDDADFPSRIQATLHVNGALVDSADINGQGDGLYAPSYFKTVPYWKKYTDNTHATQDTGGVDWK